MLEKSKHVTDDQQESSFKKQKTLSIPDTVSRTIEYTQVSDDNINDKKVEVDVAIPGDQMATSDEATSSGVPFNSSPCGSANLIKDRNRFDGTPINSEWKPLEIELYMKGLEIFGRNRYRISLPSIVY